MFYAPTVDEGIKTIIYPFQGIERIYERGTLDQVIGRVVELQGKRDVCDFNSARCPRHPRYRALSGAVCRCPLVCDQHHAPRGTARFGNLKRTTN